MLINVNIYQHPTTLNTISIYCFFSVKNMNGLNNLIKNMEFKIFSHNMIFNCTHDKRES